MAIIQQISRFAPAKINLFLAITGTRSDGFHNLVSLVAPLSLGDTLLATISPEFTTDSLDCDLEGVPTDDRNLVLKACKRFRDIVPACPYIHWTLKKQTPHGAGLGGGSSDAASALLLLNELCQGAPGEKILRELAAELGSDCPLFLNEAPVIMRGRGEQVYSLPEKNRTALSGKKLLLFKPAFGIPTAEIYNTMREAAPRFYLPAEEAEEKIAFWCEHPDSPIPQFNNMELAVFKKYPALPALFKILRERYQLSPIMSGSGSACFAFLPDNADLPKITQTIQDAWGKSAWIKTAQIN